jgi:hypothetical protein
MDWHKLQHTLYNLDPTDPREDLAKLQRSVKDSVSDTPNIDYITESIEIPNGSMPMDLNSLSDFAKLAGVAVKEDFAKGFQAVQTGGALGPDRAERAINSLVNPNDKDTSNTAGDKKQDSKAKIKGSADGAQLARKLNITNAVPFMQAIQLINSGQTITSVNHYKALAEGFVKLTQLNPQDAQFVLAQLRRANSSESTVFSVKDKPHASIKEELYKRLNAKK